MPGSPASDDSDYDSDRGYETRPSDKTFLCGVVEGNLCSYEYMILFLHCKNGIFFRLQA